MHMMRPRAASRKIELAPCVTSWVVLACDASWSAAPATALWLAWLPWQLSALAG